MKSAARILVIEDDTDRCTVIKRLLKAKSDDILSASTGAEGLKLDLVLPDISGLDVCRRIKQDPCSSSSMVLLLSAYLTDSDQQAAGIEIGGDGYIAWPVSHREFVARVELLLRLSQTEKALSAANKELQQKVSDRKAQLEAIQNHAPLIMCLLDAERKILQCNRLFAEFVGLPEGRVIGERACGILGCVCALDDPRGCGYGPSCSSCAARQSIEATVANRRGPQNVVKEFELLRGGERQHFVFTLSTVFLEVNSQPCSLLCLTDITAQKQIELTLREAVDRQTSIFDGVRDAILIADVQTGVILDANQAAVRLLKRSKETLIGSHQTELHPPEEAAHYGQIFQSRAAEFEAQPTEAMVCASDGSRIPVEINASVMQMADGRSAMIGIFRNITERVTAEEKIRRLSHVEEQLRQIQKLEGIGQLAGGVAHDFNNILAAIMMHLTMLRRNPRMDSVMLETVADLETEAKRAANLTRQLLLFSRRTIMQVKPIDLNEVIENMMKMLRRLIGENIRVESSGGGRALWIQADAGMIEQVIMNLVVNARDAIPNGGRLSLLTDMVMPEGMTGSELGQLCLAEKPDLIVIVYSGYNAEHQMTGIKDGMVRLPKPIDPDLLAAAIRRCLDNKMKPDFV